MNISYLAALPKTNEHHTKNYVLIDYSQDGIKKVIEDTIDFNRADVNSDDFLTYEELPDIKLSVYFHLKKDRFELVRGLSLLDSGSIQNIFHKKGISFDALEAELKKLDKNNDSKIDSNEVAQDITQLAKVKQKAYREYKLGVISHKENEQTEIEGSHNQIAALEKQIMSLKKMLISLEVEKVSQPIKTTQSSKDTGSQISQSMDNTLNKKELEGRYGAEDVNNMIETIERTANVSHVIDSIIVQTDTTMSKEDILNLSQGMENVDIGAVSIREAQELSAIEQFSPASTPLIIDSKNIEFSIASIKQKITDLEGMKDKVIQKIMDIQLKKIDFKI